VPRSALFERNEPNDMSLGGPVGGQHAEPVRAENHLLVSGVAEASEVTPMARLGRELVGVIDPLPVHRTRVERFARAAPSRA
jgi:hypothetical protein